MEPCQPYGPAATPTNACDYAVVLSSWRPDAPSSRRHCRLPTTEDTQIVSPDGFDISSSKRCKLNRKPDNVHFPQRPPIPGGISRDPKGVQWIQYDIVFEQLNLNV